MGNLSNADLERAYLLGVSVDPNEQRLSNSDLRDVIYGDRQTPYASNPASNLSATDVEMAARRAASANPNKQFMSLADLRREAWDTGGGGGGSSVSDDFNRANGAMGSTSVGAKAWQAAGVATWTIVSNQASHSGSGGAGSIAVDSGLSGNYDLQFVTSTFPIIAAPYAVIARGATPSTYVVIYRNGSLWVASDQAGGSPMSVAAAGAIAPGDTVKIAVRGNTFNIYVNGVLDAVLTHTAYPSGSFQGFLGWDATPITMDNFSVVPA